MIPLYKAYIPNAAAKRLESVFSSESLAYGPRCEEFGSRLAEYIDNPLLLTTGDVSSSIVLALFLAGVRPGDRVVASPLTCVATNMPILNLFARVAWCDVDPETGNISAEALDTVAADGVRAILHPHWCGDVADIGAIRSVAGRHGLPVIEDAGESLGATFGGRRVGGTGAFATVFSFHAIRQITTGEGAAIAFSDPSILEKARCLRRYGIHKPSFRDQLGEIDPRSDIPVPGFNTYMTEIAAAIGLEQMTRLDDVVARHVDNGAYYDRALREIPGVTLVRRPAMARPAYWVYTLLAERRDDLLVALRERGIYASKVHSRNDQYTCFGSAPRLPGLDAFCGRYLCIPCGWWVSLEDRESIVAAIKRGW